ncbi:MAG: hypothetical protein IJT83_16675 [Victivallales bacterium]|nr:hypothetical protein [Victivallales bacterium]
MVDLDEDGEPEVVLENEYLKVGVLTGKAPQNPPEKLNANGKPIPSKYARRFNWGGWIWEVHYKPTGREWFVHENTNSENWFGIPECFEEAIRMKELEPGKYAVLVPGIGTATGLGQCFRWSFTEIEYAPWEMHLECEIDGAWREESPAFDPAPAWRLRFVQKIDTPYGYGCACEKSIVMRAGSSRLEIQRSIQNTGSQPWRTTWFTHGFWGQGENNKLDSDCWSTIPIRHFTSQTIDTERAFLANFLPGNYWGPITAEELGGNWHVAGNAKTADIFLTALDKPIAFFRNWTTAQTYSCEPFLAIDLKPGETFSWLDMRMAGNGLQGVKAVGDNAMLDWQISEDGLLHFAILPGFKGNGKATITGAVSADGMQTPIAIESENSQYGPDAPVRMSAIIPQEYIGKTAKIALTVQLGGKTLVKVEENYRLAVKPRTEIPVLQNHPKAVVFTEMRQDKEGKLLLTPVAKFWELYLEAAGFQVQHFNWDAEAVDWEGVSLAIVAGRRMKPATLRGLEVLVRNGAGAIFQAPLDFHSFELSNLLPIEEVLGEVNLASTSPRDGTREFVGVNRKRYHLSLNENHPVVDDLPWAPETYQGIGYFQMVRSKENTHTLLSFNHADAFRGSSTFHASPALIIDTYGKGRVAYLATSITWGAPANCAIWSRLGEYHRAFFTRLAVWTANWEQKR